MKIKRIGKTWKDIGMEGEEQQTSRRTQQCK
jgi:hypothetical protein